MLYFIIIFKLYFSVELLILCDRMMCKSCSTVNSTLEMFLKFNNVFQMNKDIYSLGTSKTLNISVLVVQISLSVN